MILKIKRIKHILLPWVWVICNNTFCFAQAISKDYNISFLGIEDGLPTQNITSVVEDTQGYMWLGTLGSGLIRYDGAQLKVYSVGSEESLGLQDNEVQSVVRMSSGNIWVANDGITIINPATLEYKQILDAKAYSNVGIIRKNIVNCLFNDRHNVLWGTDRQGVFCIENENVATVQRLSLPVKDYKCSYINEDTKGVLYFFTNKGIFYWEKKMKKILLWSSRVGENEAPVFLENLEGKVVAASIGAEYLDFNTHKMTKVLPENVINSSFFEEKLKKSNNSQVSFKVFAKNKYEIWVACKYGIFILRKKQYRFQTCPELENCSVEGMLEDAISKYIYIASDRGIYEYDPKNNRAKKISDFIANQIIAKKGNTIWAFSKKTGLHLLNLTSRKNSIFPLAKDNIQTALSTCFLKQQDIYIGDNNNVFSFNINKKEYKKTLFSNPYIDFKHGKIYAITQTRDSLWWFCTSEGLYCADEKKGYISHSFESDYRLGNASEVHGFYEDNKNRIWLATKQYGLLQLDRAKHTVKAYSTLGGLCHNQTCSILGNEEDHKLWISTVKGLACFDTEKELFINYYINAGIANNEFNQGVSLKASDGLFYFGGVNGITSFYPNDVGISTNLLHVLLSDYTIYSTDENIAKHYLGFESLIQKGIWLSPKDDILELRFGCTDFFDPQKNTYAFQLIGFDKHWVFGGKNNQARYMNLAAGDYILRIKAAGSLGEWSEQIMEIPIHVAPIFYKTIWFLMIVIGIVGVLSWLFLRFRLSQIEKENTIRLNIASNIHDDLGGSLYGINSAAKRLRTKMKEQEHQSDIEHLVNVCEKAYRTMGELIWAINPKNQFTDSLIERMEDYKDDILKPFLRITTFEATGFEKNKKIDTEFKQHLLMLFKEALTNIAKHSSPEKIIIRVENNPVFSLSIINYFDKPLDTALSSGNGLEGMQRRAKQMGGILKTEQKEKYFSLKFSLKKRL
jgi:ligand-binding sensor domain-containing protein